MILQYRRSRKTIMPSATPGEDAPAASIAVNNVINVSGNSGGMTSLNITNHNHTVTSNSNHHYGSCIASIRNPPDSCLPTENNTARDKDGDNADRSTTPAEKEVVPKKGVYTADTHGCIILPHVLIQTYRKDITKELCMVYFECYAHFSRHDLCLSDVKKIVQDAGSASKAIYLISMTSVCVDNFHDILLSIRSDLVNEGTKLFTIECCNRFEKRGMKMKDSSQGPHLLHDCHAFISGRILSQLKKHPIPHIPCHSCTPMCRCCKSHDR